MSRERVYIISEEKDPPPSRVFSNLQKIVEFLGDEYELPSYAALQSRLYRSRKRTGKGVLRIKKNDGTFVVIEVKEVE